jgi:hypothetical protein
MYYISRQFESSAGLSKTLIYIKRHWQLFSLSTDALCNPCGTQGTARLWSISLSLSSNHRHTRIILRQRSYRYLCSSSPHINLTLPFPRQTIQIDDSEVAHVQATAAARGCFFDLAGWWVVSRVHCVAPEPTGGADSFLGYVGEDGQP